MKFKLIIILFLFGATACEFYDGKSESKDSISKKNNNPPKKDHSVKTDSFHKSDIISHAEVLMVGSFHGEEVSDKVNQIKWLGLFKNKANFYLKQTSIVSSLVYDPILDTDENEKTGKDIRTLVDDSCLILIEKLSFLKEKSVPHYNLMKEQFLPGEKASFQFLGVNYELYAIGECQNSSNELENQRIKNYKLYLSASINGIKSKSLIVSHQNFDDNMVKVLFVGDLDGDSFVDLIIDVSNHYNATVPSVFLSSPSMKGQLVKLIGNFTSVGC